MSDAVVGPSIRTTPLIRANSIASGVKVPEVTTIPPVARCAVTSPKSSRTTGAPTR